MPFHVMTKPAGAICNLDCTYCFYLEKEKLYKPRSAPRMSEEVLETYVRQMIDSHPTGEVGFAWQGGEPTLMGLDFFRRAVELQESLGAGREISNALQTNGVLLDPEWFEFLAEKRFLVGLSIDGPAEIHDAYRVDKGGKPTFHRVMKAVEGLKQHGVDFNTLTVVHRQNAEQPLQVYRFLKEIGSTFHQYIPLVERFSQLPTAEGLVRRVGREGDLVGERSVLPEQWGQFLCTIFDEWVTQDVGRTFVQLFEVALQSYAGVPQGLCLFRPTCGEAVALEHNGDLYSCDHYVFPEYKLGDIMDTPIDTLVGSPAQRRFGEYKMTSLPAYCRRCDVRAACNGECPKNRFLETPDGEPGLNYLCRGYKKFFRHIRPEMQFLIECFQQKKPLAEVKRFAMERRAT